MTDSIEVLWDGRYFLWDAGNHYYRNYDEHLVIYKRVPGHDRGVEVARFHRDWMVRLVKFEEKR